VSLRRDLLPLLLPLGVLLVGSLSLLTTENRTDRPSFVAQQPQPRPHYSQPPPGTGPTCQQDPSLGDALLNEGRRLGVTLQAGEPELPGKDASYRALPGRLGTIIFKQRPMSEVVRCMLISHEFIHVLQHLHGDLMGVPPLGWPTTHPDPAPQEAEAYGHQNRAGYVLQLLKATPVPG